MTYERGLQIAGKNPGKALFAPKCKKGWGMKVKTLVAVALFGWINTATADLITYDIGTGNSAISGYPGPYVEVQVSRTSTTTATVTFTSLCTSNGTTPDFRPCDATDNIYLMGDGSSAAVNVNATSWTLGAITGSNSGSGFTPGTPYSDGGSGHVNGFGVFNQTINSFDGYTHSSDVISFGLTNTSGTWLTASDVLVANSQGGVVASHIFITSYPADASGSAIVTGFAAGGTPGGPPPQEIPEPGILALLSIGLLGLSLTAMRPRKQ